LGRQPPEGINKRLEVQLLASCRALSQMAVVL
jgi:hypothetical protein